ncbi:MAG: hypothetical protein GW855_13715 [Erythrobacter sp.]|nr:hypothetical protein [Erythrobacter sp.]NCQ62918.1 hypothetical protein [Alphaproteobacteria bacterium]
MASIIERPDGTTCTDAGQPHIRILNEITVSPGRTGSDSPGSEGVAIAELDARDVAQVARMSAKRRQEALAKAIADGTVRCGFDVDKEEVDLAASQLAEMIDRERLGDFFGDDLIGRIGITITLFRFRLFGRRYEVNLKINIGIDPVP